MIGHVARGKGSGVLFLHGFALDARAWEPQLEGLADQHRSIAVDLPGFGPHPVATPGVSAAAAALAVLDALEVDRVHVVGHSLGGAIAADFALAFPHRVRTLVLVDPLMRGRDPKIAAWNRCVELARANELGDALEAWLADPLFAAASKNAGVAAKLRAIAMDYRGAHWRGEMSTAFERDPPTADVLAQILAPTLVVVGEHDLPSFHAMADEYASTVRHARKVVVPNAGHVPNLEAPDAFNARLTELFAA
ncbi:MAG TPA: alpha/beta fold hydrolase [Polyangiaceae bacterium]